LACAENFIYVFFRVGLNARDQSLTLLLRSIFPIHALCAAMQSVGVIKKYIEGRQNIGVGKIIIPAILLHGSFDAVLLVVNLFAEYYQGYYNPLLLHSLTLLAIVGIIFLAMFWYWDQRCNQRLRLIDMINEEDDQMAAENAGTQKKKWEYNSPALSTGNDEPQAMEMTRASASSRPHRKLHEGERDRSKSRHRSSSRRRSRSRQQKRSTSRHVEDPRRGRARDSSQARDHRGRSKGEPRQRTRSGDKQRTRSGDKQRTRSGDKQRTRSGDRKSRERSPVNSDGSNAVKRERTTRGRR